MIFELSYNEVTRVHNGESALCACERVRGAEKAVALPLFHITIENRRFVFIIGRKDKSVLRYLLCKKILPIEIRC